MQIKPAQKHYSTVQIDEVWSFVGQRKKGKYWLFYAYSAEYDKILTYTCGSRSATTLQTLLRKLQGVNIDQYCTDYWKAFAKILPTEKHRIGKAYTKNIEGVNTCLIARNKRLVR
uniref:IS1 family transposase n=1 Tax=Adhaeribacter swui TaxID=2086471 RepID=UPI003742CEC0